MSGRWDNSRYRNICYILDSYGIEPDKVCEEGFSAAGYTVFTFFEGKKVMGEDGPLREEKPWPSRVPQKAINEMVAEYERIQGLLDTEEFCPSCLAGIESAEHFEKCGGES